MLQFRKTLLGGIAPALLSIALASPVVASDAHHAHHKDHNFGAFTKDNLLLTPKDYREWIFVGGPVTPNDIIIKLINSVSNHDIMSFYHEIEHAESLFLYSNVIRCSTQGRFT